jgi:hypothetical protein
MYHKNLIVILCSDRRLKIRGFPMIFVLSKQAGLVFRINGLVIATIAMLMND